MTDRDGIALRVITYNVHSQRDDLAALAAVVRELAPDVMLVQEAPRRLRWRTRCADLAHRFGLVHAGGGLPSLGNAVFTSYRVAVPETWALRFPLTPGRHLRGAVLARCVVGRTPFVVAGSHLGTDPDERPGQAALIGKAMADADAPVIFAGDLNETSGGAAWRTISDGLIDAAVATGRESAGTFPAAGPTRRMDAVFVDRSIGVRDYRVVDTPAARRASDHLPVVADLLLPTGWTSPAVP